MFFRFAEVELRFLRAAFESKGVYIIEYNYRFKPITTQMTTNENKEEGKNLRNDLNEEILYHGTKAKLKQGDLIEPGYNSNYGKRKKALYVYVSATLDAAAWGAELALGDGPGRIYIVEATGPIEDDPNLTDKKFPGNPTKSYRSKNPFCVIKELTHWQGHSSEQVEKMQKHLDELRAQGIEAIED